MTDAATLDALAYLFIAFGHSTDDALTPEEMKSLAGHLRTWAPDQDDSSVATALQGAVAAYQKQPTLEDKLGRALELAKVLAGSLPEDQPPKILADLESIAAADGEVSREERSLMQAVAKVMGVG